MAYPIGDAIVSVFNAVKMAPILDYNLAVWWVIIDIFFAAFLCIPAAYFFWRGAFKQFLKLQLRKPDVWGFVRPGRAVDTFYKYYTWFDTHNN